MSEPIRKEYSREDMFAAAALWMEEQYGNPDEIDEDESDLWHIRIKLLYNFIFDQFQPKEP